MKVPEYDRRVGIEVYGTATDGIGGRIKQVAEDFIVEEALTDGTVAQVAPEETQKVVGEGENLICVLVKRNWDTILALEQVASRLGVGKRRIRYAGIKDAKALTAQHVSIWNISPKEVGRVRVKDIELRPEKFSTKPIRLKDLLGNRFRITIRQIEGKADAVKDRIEPILKGVRDVGGVPNFFGHQRFGTVTHVVGKKLVKGSFEEAALTFLAATRSLEEVDAAEARKKLRSAQDYKQALKDFPRHLKFEIAMLNYLARYPNDFTNAFRALPRRLGRMFVQAYQSYLFNRLLGQKLSTTPSKGGEVGDYVTELDSHGLPSKVAKLIVQEDKMKINEDLRDGKKCLVLPIFGYKTEVPDSADGDVERKILSEENVQLDDFYLPELKEFSSQGAFRPMIAPINDFDVSRIAEDSLNPDRVAVELEFSLRRGEYATILLREIMKPEEPMNMGF